MAFTVHADRQLIRAGARRRRFLCAEIQAPQAPPRPGRLPVNLAFVLDRSGSMDGAKIAHAREAVLQGLRSLRAEDRFAVVAYDDRVDLVVPTTLATPDAREAAAGIVSRIQPRGSTDLHGGWHRGCEQVAEHLSTDAVARCLLLTDGLANCGLTDHDEIVRRCKTWRERRVVTTAFGVGADFDETLLRRMADAGGGHFEFIASSVQIPDFVASEVGEALAIVAREAVLVVEAGEGTIVESLNDFPVRKDGTTTWRVEIGSLAGGQNLHPVLGVTFPANEAGTTREVVVRVEDAGGALGGPSARTTFTWASQEDDDRQPRDRAVDRRVAALQAARAERDALERNRARDFGAARAIVEHCVDHIREYAGDDPEILAVLEDLQQKADRYGRDLDGLTRKTLHYTSSLALKQRHMLKARRRQGPPAKVSVLASADLGDLLDPVIAHLVAADADLFGGLAFDPAPTMWTGPGPLDPAEEARLLDSTLARAVPAAIRVVFTTRALSDRWFSHWHESRGAAVVSLAGWGGGYAAPVEAFVAYEVILHGLRALGSCWLPDQWMHPETRGCLFDFCENRQDMELKLQAADLCPSCRATLGRIGLPLDRLANLLEVVRTLAVPATVVH